MKKIELFPKFYGKEERKDRTVKMKKAVKELLNSDLLSEKVKEKVKTVICDMDIMGDTYSRNYEIKKLNSLIECFNSLKQ